MDGNIFKDQICIRIKQIRILKGWSRDQVADKLGISVAGYGSIERGETDISVTRLAKLAEIFGMTVFDLLGITEKTTFNFTQPNNSCHNWQVNPVSPPHNFSEFLLQQELEKYKFVHQSQQKEIEHLHREILRLEEIISLLKNQ